MNRLKRYLVAPLLALALLVGASGVAQADTWWRTAWNGADLCVQGRVDSSIYYPTSSVRLEAWSQARKENGTGDCGAYDAASSGAVRVGYVLQVKRFPSGGSPYWDACTSTTTWAYNPSTYGQGIAYANDSLSAGGIFYNNDCPDMTNATTNPKFRWVVYVQRFVWLTWQGASYCSDSYQVPLLGGDPTKVFASTDGSCGG